MLSKAGLTTIRTQGYAFLWGLQEIPFFGRNGNSKSPSRPEPSPSSEPIPIDVDELVADRQTSVLKKLLASEDDAVPIFGLGVKLMRWSVGNMMMYVCRRA
jgi:hypothetical protein